MTNFKIGIWVLLSHLHGVLRLLDPDDLFPVTLERLNWDKCLGLPLHWVFVFFHFYIISSSIYFVPFIFDRHI